MGHSGVVLYLCHVMLTIVVFCCLLLWFAAVFFFKYYVEWLVYRYCPDDENAVPYDRFPTCKEFIRYSHFGEPYPPGTLKEEYPPERRFL